jgi:hypothetical protein
MSTGLRNGELRALTWDCIKRNTGKHLDGFCKDQPETMNKVQEKALASHLPSVSNPISAL